MNIVLGRGTLGPRSIAPEICHKIQRCSAHKPSLSAVLSRINGGKKSKPSQRLRAANIEGSPSDSSRSEDTLKLLDSLLGSVDESELAGTINPQRAVSTSASSTSSGSGSLEDLVSLQQLSAPLQGDIHTSIGCAEITILSIA